MELLTYDKAAQAKLLDFFCSVGVAARRFGAAGSSRRWARSGTGRLGARARTHHHRAGTAQRRRGLSADNGRDRGKGTCDTANAWVDDRLSDMCVTASRYQNGMRCVRTCYGRSRCRSKPVNIDSCPCGGPSGAGYGLPCRRRRASLRRPPRFLQYPIVRATGTRNAQEHCHPERWNRE